MKTEIAIVGAGALSPVGSSRAETTENYQSAESRIVQVEIGGRIVPVGRLSRSGESRIAELLDSGAIPRALDRSVELAISAASDSFQEAEWSSSDDVGVVLGSSRGATSRLEESFQEFLRGRVGPLTSPTTTLGNLSSNVAHYLGLNGPALSLSVTCSSSLHALITGITWIQSGLVSKVLAGGTEAPLTPFTISQMEALRIYSQISKEYPCRPIASGDSVDDTFVLGEGAAVFSLIALNRVTDSRNILGVITGIGVGLEKIESATGISDDGEALYLSMSRALKSSGIKDGVDLVVLHAPGTRKGDRAELNAIEKVFRDNTPLVASPKWVIGHTLGASGALGIEYALHILSTQEVPSFPYPVRWEARSRPIGSVMVNAAGFGGNAASVIVRRVESKR